MRRRKIATAHLAGCFGCHMSLLDIDERLLDLIEMADLEKSPLNDIKRFRRKCSLGFIEGGCHSDENVQVLSTFRENCEILIAVGDCATNGNIPAMRNLFSLQECLEEAFLNGPSVTNGMIPSDPDIPLLLDRVYPAHEVVKIDYFLPGCPPSADAIWTALNAILKGESLSLPQGLVRYD